MKITAVKTYKLSVPTGQEIDDSKTGQMHRSSTKTWLLLKLETDVGIDGWGDATGEWLVPMAEATLHDWIPLLLDRNPVEVVALTEDVAARSPWKGGPVFGTALAAVNMALYDITGKAWKVPVHTLLGGKRRDRIRCYSNGGNYTDPAKAVESALKNKARGWAGTKGNPLEGRTWPMDMAAVEVSSDCVQAVREAVGDDHEILLDAHGSPIPELSIALAQRIARFRPLFFEEPVKVGSVDALAEVSRQSPIPIATGEKLFTVEAFRPLIDRRACAVLQPDVTHCFGITTMLEIARLAEYQQMLMAPHNTCSPVGHAATLQADAVMNNFLIQEVTGVYFQCYDRYADHDWVVADGHLNVSDRPGLGIEVKEVDIAAMPYQRMPYRQYHHEDGSWKGW